MSKQTEIVFIVEEAPEGGYTARGVGADIITDAHTLDELRANVWEAVECHFEAGSAPRLVPLQLSGG